MYKRSKNLSTINNDESEPEFDENKELDTRADTTCAGANWILLSASGRCCDVYGLCDDFKGI